MQLVTARLVLREVVEEDALLANTWERDPAVVRLTSFEPQTLDDSRAHIRRAIDGAAQVPRALFDLAITLAGDGRLIGRTVLSLDDAAQGQGALFYLIGPGYQGAGYALEAARALRDHGFGALGLHRIFCDIDPRNQASVRVAEKLGMRREAHLVENVWQKDEWMSTLIYAMLAREWRASES